MTGWNITFEIITPESAAEGEAESQGFELENGTLREALDIFGTRGYCEANEYPIIAPNWLTRYDAENYHSGETRNLSLHIPARITPASRRRLARALGCPWR